MDVGCAETLFQLRVHHRRGARGNRVRLWVRRGIAVAFAATVVTGAFGAGGGWAGRTIHVPFAASAPTIDGNFSLVEWSAATGSAFNMYDPQGVGTGVATVYLEHDASNLYVAFLAPDINVGDRALRLFFECCNSPTILQNDDVLLDT